MRNSIRSGAGIPTLRPAIACCTSIAQRTASTTLANSTSNPSPVVLTIPAAMCGDLGIDQFAPDAPSGVPACLPRRRPSADCSRQYRPPGSPLTVAPHAPRSRFSPRDARRKNGPHKPDFAPWAETDQQCGEARTAAVGSYRLSQASRRFKIGGSEDIATSGFRSALQPAGEVVKVSCGLI